MKNKPVPIKNLNKYNLTGTASQKLCLLRMLPLIIGPKVPTENEVWRLLTLCRQIVDISLSPQVQVEDLVKLEGLIAEHNHLYGKYSPSFPSKFHFLVHYPNLIRKYGPLRNFWCMRFEAKHQNLKRLASLVRNFRNIDKTLASRQQFLQCYFFNEIHPAQNLITSTVHAYESNLLSEELKSELKPHLKGRELPKKILSAKSIKSNLQVDSVLAIDCIDGNDIPIFGKINAVLKVYESWFICCKVLLSVCFNDHFHAFEVRETEHWHVLDPEKTGFMQCLDQYKIEDKAMVTLQYNICSN